MEKFVTGCLGLAGLGLLVFVGSPGDPDRHVGVWMFLGFGLLAGLCTLCASIFSRNGTTTAGNGYKAWASEHAQEVIVVICWGTATGLIAVYLIGKGVPTGAAIMIGAILAGLLVWLGYWVLHNKKDAGTLVGNALLWAILLPFKLFGKVWGIIFVAALIIIPTFVWQLVRFISG